MLYEQPLSDASSNSVFLKSIIDRKGHWSKTGITGPEEEWLMESKDITKFILKK